MNESLAVIVALTDPALPDLGEALARFAEEAGPGGEVLVVDASGSSESESWAEQFANLRVIRRPVGRLAPSLWRDGLLATEADLVAFTTAQMVPRRGWIEALKARMRETGAAGVGGPIEPGVKLSPTDQAVALLRYANYFNSFPRSAWESRPRRSASVSPGSAPLGTRSVQDGIPTQSVGTREGEWGSRRGGPLTNPPGDNALYRRDLLMAVESSWLDGFWEVEVHQALRNRNESLAMSDRAIVTFVGGVGLASMAAQRFRHAWRYGKGRSTGLGAMARLARVAAAPLVPALLCARIVKALRARGMALVPWLPALVPLVGLASAWAIGEAVGTLSVDRRHESMPRQIREVA